MASESVVNRVDQFDDALILIEEATAIQEMAWRIRLDNAEDAEMLKLVSHRTFLMLEQAKDLLLTFRAGD